MAGLNHQRNFWKYLKTSTFISSSTSWSSAHPPLEPNSLVPGAQLPSNNLFRAGEQRWQ